MNKRLQRQKAEVTRQERIGRFSIVVIKGNNGNVGVGISRLSDTDKDIPRLGMDLAKGRAMSSLWLKNQGIKLEGNHIFYG